VRGLDAVYHALAQLWERGKMEPKRPYYEKGLSVVTAVSRIVAALPKGIIKFGVAVVLPVDKHSKDIERYLPPRGVRHE
jgi:hypothetical protein